MKARGGRPGPARPGRRGGDLIDSRPGGAGKGTNRDTIMAIDNAKQLQLRLKGYEAIS
jgi:hypothetical protein